MGKAGRQAITEPEESREMVQGLLVQLRGGRFAPLAAVVVIGAVLNACSGDDDIIDPPGLGTVDDLSVAAHGAFEARLTWSDVSGEIAYDVHRSPTPDFGPGASTRIAQGLAAGTTEYADIRVNEQSTYYYKVIARDAVESTTSNEVTVTTPAIGRYPLVEDGFERAVSTGWGMTPAGDVWSKDNEVPWRVANGEGLVEISDSVARNNVLVDLDTYGRYVYGLVRFRIDTPPDAGFHTVSVYARRNDAEGDDGENQYRYSVMADADGTLSIRIEKEVESVHDFLTNQTVVPPTFQADQWYWIRWEATGTAPTHLRMKLWARGNAEPDAWDLDIEHHEPLLDVKGTTGVRVQAPSTQTTFPVTFAFDDLSYEGD